MLFTSLEFFIFLPLVLGYQAWTYYVFRRRVSASEFQPGASSPAEVPEPRAAEHPRRSVRPGS